MYYKVFYGRIKNHRGPFTMPKVKVKTVRMQDGKRNIIYNFAVYVILGID